MIFTSRTGKLCPAFFYNKPPSYEFKFTHKSLCNDESSCQQKSFGKNPEKQQACEVAWA